MTKIIFTFINLMLVSTLVAQYIGINNADPQAALDISGDIRLRSHTLTLSFSYQHDLDISTHKYSVYKIDPTATTGAIITGMNGGIDGRIVTFINTSTAWSLQFFPENDPISSLSLETNRFVSPIGQPIVVAPSGSASFRYDGTKMRWTAVSGSFTEGIDTYPNAWPSNGLDIYNNNIGNVGIGLVNPSEKLEVVGNIKTNGEIKPNGISGQANEVLTSNGDGTMQWMPIPSTSENTGNYGTVTNPITGKIWLDRNLGATQVALSSTDVLSYGDLYQWGRNADGHQSRSSGVTTNLSTNFFTNNSLFIANATSQPYNWLSSGTSNMWESTESENNPCPSGFRIPTAAEWEQERRTWLSNDADGAFASELKLATPGSRFINGTITDVGNSAIYWSKSTLNTESYHLYFTSNNAYIGTAVRAFGGSVRCIKD